MMEFGLYHTGWGYMAPLFVIIWWAIAIAAIVFFVRWLSVQGGGHHHHHQGRHVDSALEILKERYAKGEIGKEEFESKKKDLS